MSTFRNKAAKPVAGSSASASTIPTPFTRAPPRLQPFLERLDPARVHITHVDRQSRAHKQRIFLIPVVLNTVIAGLLLWRAAAALPFYAELLRTLAGQHTAASVDVARTTRAQQLGILARRVAVMFADFLLFRFVGPWPLTFFAEQPANPCTWRWRVGWRAEEAVVRVSRHWGADELMKGVRQGEDNAFFRNRVLPAIDPAFMLKTGYLMMDGSWDLEFELMQDAHALVERGSFALDDLDKLVLAFQEGVGWIAWRWEAVDDVVEARRKQVVKFKERLTAMGKESLFWRWTEIVEQERDLDGGFTPDGQQRVARRVQAEFEKEGVDFSELTKSIGGLVEIPVQS